MQLNLALPAQTPADRMTGRWRYADGTTVLRSLPLAPMCYVMFRDGTTVRDDEGHVRYFADEHEAAAWALTQGVG
jgi:hypothetical protein